MANVIVYSTSTCPWCDKVKEFLKQNNVEFEERNAQLNPQYATELQEKSGGVGVPVIDVDGTIIIGYNEKKLREVLKI
jgi:glutaredoxin-like YruB-family protein